MFEDMKELILDDIHVTVQRKSIKNMYLRVQPDGNVLLTAPRFISDQAITRFANERLRWIQTHVSACSARPAMQYVSGDSLFLWGVPCSLTVIPDAKRSHARLDNGQLLLHVPKESTVEIRARAVEQWYRKQMEAVLPRLMEQGEATVGKHASALRIRSMTTRWGTCNTATGVITLNLELAKRPQIYLSYVIIHELTHLIEPSHNARFYALMDRFCPQWKSLRRQLKTDV